MDNLIQYWRAVDVIVGHLEYLAILANHTTAIRLADQIMFEKWMKTGNGGTNFVMSLELWKN